MLSSIISHTEWWLDTLFCAYPHLIKSMNQPSSPLSLFPLRIWSTTCLRPPRRSHKRPYDHQPQPWHYSHHPQGRFTSPLPLPKLDPVVELAADSRRQETKTNGEEVMFGGRSPSIVKAGDEVVWWRSPLTGVAGATTLGGSVWMRTWDRD